ncbi:ATP-grasp domain-containing protein [Myxococcota bacterium]|nr:ATP-grasp domain-containing protein [Myxococcota bacterium]
MKERPEKTVLVLGAHRQSLAVMRSIHRMGHRVCLGHDEPRPSFCDASRWADEVWRCPPGTWAQPSSFLSALLDFLKQRDDVVCIFPVGTREINVLLAVAEKLPGSVRLIAPRSDLWSRCLQKSQMAAIVESLGIPTAPLVSVLGRSAVTEAVESVGLPCIVKPVSEEATIGGEKALILRDREGLSLFLNSEGLDPAPLLVQKYFQGRRHNLYFVAEHGRVVAVEETRVDRTDRSNGTGLGVAGRRIQQSPEWSSHLEQLVAHLDYHGMGCLQFLESEQTGEGCFLEVNARLGANYGHLQKSGSRLLERWIQQVVPSAHPAGDRQETVRSLKYAWTYGELRSIERSWIDGSAGLGETVGALLKMVQSAFKADVHLDGSWRDPRPAWILYRRYLASLSKRLYRKARPAPERLARPRRAQSALPR